MKTHHSDCCRIVRPARVLDMWLAFVKDSIGVRLNEPVDMEQGERR